MLTIRSELTAGIQASQSIIAGVHQLDANGTYVRSAQERSLVIEASYVKIYIAFEAFLEKAFIHFMMAGTSTTGWMPTSFSQAPSSRHAMDMLTMGKKFVDWSTPSTVGMLAKLHFDHGSPFQTVLVSANSDLLDMKNLRNACSHLSTNTSAQLDALYTRYTGRAKQSVAPYEMAMAAGRGNGEVFMTKSIRIIGQIADQIAHYS